MALTADRHLDLLDDGSFTNHGNAGVADTLYKNAMVNIDKATGYVVVSADSVGHAFFGITQKQVVADGTTHEDVLVTVGRFWMPFAGAVRTDIKKAVYAIGDDTLALTATNVPRCGTIIDYKPGYYLVDFRDMEV